MSMETPLEIPAGYRRGVRFGALWTMISSPYLIFYLILVILIGLADDGTTAQVLEFAGSRPWAFGLTVILDGLQHVVFFVTLLTIFTVIRLRWPVRASLLLVLGAWQMIAALIKVLAATYIFTRLGSTYLQSGDSARLALLPIADAMTALRAALQEMDTIGIAGTWIVIALLPSATGLPRLVRILGGLLAIAVLGPDPGFLLVIVLSPFFLFLLGRWLNRLAATPELAATAAEPPVPLPAGT